MIGVGAVSMHGPRTVAGPGGTFGDLVLHAPLAAAWKRRSDSGVMPHTVQGSQVGTLFVQGDPDVPPVRSIFIAHERIT